MFGWQPNIEMFKKQTYMRCHYPKPLVTVNEMVEAYQSVLSKHGLYMTNGESYFKLI